MHVHKSYQRMKKVNSRYNHLTRQLTVRSTSAEIAMEKAMILLAVVLCGVFDIGTSIYLENRETPISPDSPYDNWQPMETSVGTYVEPNQVYSQSQPNQGSTSWQQSAPSSDNNWSPSSGVEAPGPMQQQYPSTTALPYPVPPVANYATTAASYQSPSTIGYPAYSQPSAGYTSARRCKEGTRRPIPDQLSGYVICDNGVWIAMICAPGTIFHALREQCMVARSLKIAIRAPPSQPSAYSSPSSSTSYSQPQRSVQQPQQSQTYVQAAPSSDRYPQQVQQQQQPQQQFASQQTSYDTIQSSDSSVQQVNYAQPTVGNSNNDTSTSYNPQQPQPQQAQYPAQSQPPHPQSYQPQEQPFRQQQPVVRAHVTSNVQSPSVYQQQRQQQQPVKPVNMYAIPQSAQQQAGVYANPQPQPMPSAPQYQQVQVQQPSYATARPPSSQYVQAQQPQQQQQASWLPAGTGVAQGWQPAPAPQMYQPRVSVRNSQVQPSQTAVQATPDQSIEYNQKPNTIQSYSNQQPPALPLYQAPASSQLAGQQSALQSDTSYESQQIKTGGKLRITVAI